VPLDVENGRLVACSTICTQFGDSIDLVRVDCLPAPAYGFDPSGWLLYRVEQSDLYRLCGDWIVAVNAETGEYRDLGRLGD
jgi:hypothetical protein